MDEPSSESSIWKGFFVACGKIFITTLFFYCILLLLLSFVFFVFHPALKPNGIDVLVLANIGILFSSSCVLALGGWISQTYRLPNLLEFLSDQSELKIHTAPLHKKAAATKSNVYVEKVRSMNTVVSILILIVTVIMLLNHELGKMDPPTGATRITPDFRKFMLDMNYFLGLLVFLFGLWTAEILDTAANLFVDRRGMAAGSLQQRFFYHRALWFGGSGYCYVTIGFFSLMVLSIFSLLLSPVLITVTFIFVLFFASVYFYGYYKEYLIEDDDKSEKIIIILRGENKSSDRHTRWRFGIWWQILWGVFLGTLVVGIIMWWVMYCWFDNYSGQGWCPNGFVRLKSDANLLIWLYISFYTFVLGSEIHSPVLLPGIRRLYDETV